MEIVKIKTPFIKLDQFLKYISVADNGAFAKIIIKSGDVFVNGNVETRRGKKLYKGDIVRFDYKDYLVD